MKRCLLFGLFVALALCCVPAQAQSSTYHQSGVDHHGYRDDASLTVITPTRDTWVTVITDAYANEFQYGWWDAWHEIKANRRYVLAPYTFRHLPPGGYTLVVYDPATADLVDIPEDASDGVVIEQIYLQDGHQHFFVFTDKDFIDWHCLSCPWLYIHNGKEYVRTTEILKDVVGDANKTTTVVTITQVVRYAYQRPHLVIPSAVEGSRPLKWA